jgi:hypothetical protein
MGGAQSEERKPRVLQGLPTKLPELNKEWLEEEEFISKNIYSHIDNCKVIDEWMHTAFEGMGLTISEFWTNLRLVVATFACLISFHAYFGLQWPETRPKMSCCVAIFWIFQSMVIYIDKFMLKGTICTVRWGFGNRVFFNAKITKATEDIELSVKTEEPEIFVARNVSVGKFFTNEGHLCQENLHSEYASMVEELQKEFFASKKND